MSQAVCLYFETHIYGKLLFTILWQAESEVYIYRMILWQLGSFAELGGECGEITGTLDHKVHVLSCISQQKYANLA